MLKGKSKYSKGLLPETGRVYIYISILRRSTHIAFNGKSQLREQRIH